MYNYMILTEKEFLKCYKCNKSGKKGALFLKKRNVLPLFPSPELSSIVGHLIGDGSFSKDQYVGEFRFFGSENKLQIIQKKVWNIFKISPKRFYERKGGFVLRYNNCTASRVLCLIGVPRGNKVMKAFSIPKWIKKRNNEGGFY